MSQNSELRAGALNLLQDCVGVQNGDHVLFIREHSRYGYYDETAGNAVEEESRGLGANVHTLWTPPIESAETLPKIVSSAMQHADHTIFFSRIGDQLRFCDDLGPGTITMTYALDAGFLGSQFCRVPHSLMQDVLSKLQAELDSAREWHITCPLGTDVRGSIDSDAIASGNTGGFTLSLFPVSIFRPIPCRSMSGKVVLNRWIVGTANRSYEPKQLMLDQPVIAIVEQGHIVDFQGDPKNVVAVRDHYKMVSQKFDIDGDVVHSWHAGIHPKTFYPQPAETDLERWGGVTFASPRYLHFHTCGDYSPGEIAWVVIDASVDFDGTFYWKDGQFVFLERGDVRVLLPKYSVDETAFDMRQDIGI
ncbi:MAG: hypothetical protein OEU36_15435 [Gammaproteobacteria bacterium]|nr:hypothetical protein [Gammaproteobacteria bacterium]